MCKKNLKKKVVKNIQNNFNKIMVNALKNVTEE